MNDGTQHLICFYQINVERNWTQGDNFEEIMWLVVLVVVVVRKLNNNN